MNKKIFALASLIAYGMSGVPALDTETLTRLTDPITFTRSGLENFFVDTFNSPAYTEHVLHSHFGHVLNFLHYGSQLDNPHDFLTTVLEIFHTRLHECLWVDARSFSHLINNFPDYFEPLCQRSDEQFFEQEVQKLIHSALLKQYTQHVSTQKSLTSFDQFIEISQELVAPLSKDIVRLAERQLYNKPLQNLQDALTRFTENGLQKLIWDPRYPQDSWKSFHHLAHQITVMQYAGLIGTPLRANQLYWTLLYRYAFFLRAMKEQLGKQFFEAIKYDLVNSSYAWLDVPEQEEFLLSKLSYLKHVMWECAFDLNVQSARGL